MSEARQQAVTQSVRQLKERTTRLRHRHIQFVHGLEVVRVSNENRDIQVSGLVPERSTSPALYYALACRTISSSLLTAMRKEDEYEPAEAGILETTHARDARHTSTLMEGIKEELFQIEVERKQGQISRAEYEKAKAALDQTLARELKREAQQA
jgi:hypothetical protein